jgi:hypothetical protein
MMGDAMFRTCLIVGVAIVSLSAQSPALTKQIERTRATAFPINQGWNNFISFGDSMDFYYYLKDYLGHEQEREITVWTRHYDYSRNTVSVENISIDRIGRKVKYNNIALNDLRSGEMVPLAGIEWMKRQGWQAIKPETAYDYLCDIFNKNALALAQAPSPAPKVEPAELDVYQQTQNTFFPITEDGHWMYYASRKGDKSNFFLNVDDLVRQSGKSVVSIWTREYDHDRLFVNIRQIVIDIENRKSKMTYFAFNKMDTGKATRTCSNDCETEWEIIIPDTIDWALCSKIEELQRIVKSIAVPDDKGPKKKKKQR